MAKHRREIRKKGETEEIKRTEISPPAEAERFAAQEGETDVPVRAEIPKAPPPQAAEEPRPQEAARGSEEGPRAFWTSARKENVLLLCLVLYVILLGLGTVGELFEVDWILQLPIFK